MKTELPYNVTNNLDEFINKEVGKRMISGKRVLKKEIMDEIASHCGVGYENINRIKRKISQPSIGVALKIADYFNANVEDIFKIC